MLIKMFHPSHSRLWQPIITKLTENLSLSVAEEVTQVSLSTLRRARKTPADFLLSRATVAVEIKTTRVSEEEVIWISNCSLSMHQHSLAVSQGE